MDVSLYPLRKAITSKLRVNAETCTQADTHSAKTVEPLEAFALQRQKTEQREGFLGPPPFALQLMVNSSYFQYRLYYHPLQSWLGHVLPWSSCVLVCPLVYLKYLLCLKLCGKFNRKEG